MATLKQTLYRIRRKLFRPEASKGTHELNYWKLRKREEGSLANDHYSHFYTDFFDLPYAWYAGKTIADIGCGPRGSLEWANNTANRYGIDPLANDYLKLGASAHAMTYLNAGSEKIPLPDAHCDVVCSFNSLDHVDDLDKTLAEIKRITKPGGYFLLITDVNHEPTDCEPITLEWDLPAKLAPEFKILTERHFERSEKGVYQSLDENIPYDHQNPAERYGLLVVKFERR